MIYKNLELHYTRNRDSYYSFISILMNRFNLDEDTALRFTKRMLVGTISQKSRINIYSKPFFLISIIVYLMMLIYLMLMVVTSLFYKSRKYTFYTVYDAWNEDEEANTLAFNSFYSNIISKTKQKNTSDGIFKPHYFKKKESNLSNKYTLKSMSVNLILNSSDAILLLKGSILSFLFFLNYSYHKKTNFVYLYLKFVYYYIVYTLRVQNVKEVKNFVSAGDNYFDPMMYFIYKKNGIKNILLIQTAIRGEDFQSSFFMTCDSYFAFDKRIVNNYLGLKAYNGVKHIASFKLYNAVKDINIKESKYDIVFIETPADNEAIMDKNHPNYLHARSFFNSLEMLNKFAEKYPTIKVLYRVKRKGKFPKKEKLFEEKRNSILRDSLIILDKKIHKNSYEAILDSKLVLYVFSTMGLESITLGKRVLCCNLDRIGNLLSCKDEIGVIVENSFDIFEEKILTLLNDGNVNVQNYFQEKQKKYGNLKENPSSIIYSNLIQ